MRFYRIFETFFLKCINFVWCFFVKTHEKKNIRKKKNLYYKQTLTNEQKRLIDNFYMDNYGKKIPYHWHQLYQSYTGNFDYKYIPEYLYTTKLELLNNKRINVLPFENKALLSNFTRGMEDKVRIPKTYIMCVHGRFYNGNGDVLKKKDAIDMLSNTKNDSCFMICKKTVDTSSGRDVRMLEVKDGIDLIRNESIDDIIDSMGDDFVVQERINAHPAFSALYSKSINTLRVVSYVTSNKYKTAPIIIRIGRDGYVDNAHAGGMFVGVTDDGILLKEAFTEYQERYFEHPVSGIKFEGHILPCVPQIIQTAIQMHKNYPSMRFISWDFTVDENEKIVLIEANLHSQTVWFSQIAHGKSFFGDDTAEMLQLISKKLYK